MAKKTLFQAIAAIALLTLAGTITFRFYRNSGADSDGRIYFYDLSEQKLFTAPRSAIPPIAGINDAELDAVRAIVISTSGDARDKKHQKIAYLEKYTPEMKKQFEAVRQAQAAGQSTAGLIGHGVVPVNTLVRRLADAEWFPMNSAEGERIVSEWNVAGPDGNYPVVCVP